MRIWKVLIFAGLMVLLQSCGPSWRTDAAWQQSVDLESLSFDADMQVDLPASLHRRPKVLALSGGGPDGAFGSGYLVARQQLRCVRPDVLTGVSIGALIAVASFARMEDRLISLFAEGGITAIRPRPDLLRAAASGSLSDGGAYRRLVERFVDKTLIERIADQHRRGRRLYVATTDLNLMRMTAWDMGRLAVAGRTSDRRLFQDILVASASVPGVFPALSLPAADGRRHLHVDGGVTGQIYVPNLSSQTRNPEIVMVFNNGLTADPVPDRATLLVTIQRSVSSLLRAQSRQQAMLARKMAEDLGGEFRLVAIPPRAPIARLQDFSADHIAQTFQLGFSIGNESRTDCR